MHPKAIPGSLRGVAIRSADAPLRGLSPRRTRAHDVDHPFHGVIGFDLPLTTAVERCRAYEPRLLDGQLFSHTTALELWGAPLGRGRSDSVHLSVLFPRTPPRAVGAVGHSLLRVDPAIRHGLPLSSAAAAWCESAALLDRIELVAAGDALVTGVRAAGVRATPVATISELRSALTLRRGSPGSGRALWALDRVRAGVDSFAETQLRMLLVRHRLPEPSTDCPVRVAGGLLLHADLGYPDARIAIEYEGDEHRSDRRRWMRDIRRREFMEDAGWRVIRVVQLDLDDPTALVARVRLLLSRAS